MNWFIVVFFLVNGTWIEADQMGEHGWSPITQPNYKVCIQKINESNERFIKIADYREIEVDIKFECECRENLEKPREIHMSERLRSLCANNSKILAIIDFPRVPGILKALE